MRIQSLVSSLLLWNVAVGAGDDSAVHKLTEGIFDEFMKENPVALVKFVAPWCGHCKKLAPEYVKAAEVLKDIKIPLGEVDATVETELAKKFDIHGYPTLLLFRNGKPEPYTGGRTKETIVDWVKMMVEPALKWIDEFNAEKINQTTFVGRFATKEDKMVTAYEEVADSHRTLGKFFAIIDPKASVPTITAYREHEGDVSLTLQSPEKLSAWVATESIPLFGPINAENYAKYAERSKNWLWFAGNEEDYLKNGPVVRKVSKMYRTDLNFVWLNTDQLKGHAEEALGLKSFPSIAVVWDEIKYHLEDSITEKALAKFLQQVRSGKAKKFFKTEPVPESNDKPVKVVVGTTFTEMVLSKERDVLLEVYAPWCGHCKTLAPIWEELANKLKDKERITIAKIDGTANEIEEPGFRFEGFPTIYWVKAGSKTPIVYDGDRTFEGFMDFLKKESSFPEDLEELREEKDEL